MKKQCPKCKSTYTSTTLEFCVCGGKLVTVGVTPLEGFNPTGNKNIDSIMDKFHEIMDRK